MNDEEKQIKRKGILSELRAEEDTENELIWLYQTLMDLGIENCFPQSERENFRSGMKTLKEESEMHKKMINVIIDKYDN